MSEGRHIAELLPSTREGARRLGLVTLEQMVDALTGAVENPASGMRVVGVPEIRAGVEAKSLDQQGFWAGPR